MRCGEEKTEDGSPKTGRKASPSGLDGAGAWPRAAQVWRRDGGFTLIEMMVVIVIIGLIAGLAIVQLSNRADKAKVETTKARLQTLAGAIDSFKLELNRYPERIEDVVFMPADIDPRKWPPGGFLKLVPKDGWDEPFIYRRPGTRGQPYDLISHGEDRREGGEGYAEDLWNHEAYKK